MDHTGVMYLTNFIKNEVDDREDKLRDIYEKAVRDSDSYKELEGIRKQLVFFDNGVGGTLFREGNDLMHRVFDEPENGQELFGRMRNLTKDIRLEEARSMQVLKSPVKLGDSSQTVGVLEKEINDEYGSMLNILASSMIYTLLVTGGTADINGLRWNDDNSLNVKLNLINNEILPRLINSSSDVYLWKLTRVQDDKRIRFCDFRYKLDYISYADYRMYVSNMSRLSDNIYMDEQLGCSDSCGVVYVGMGNIVGCNSDDCVKRLSEGVLVKDDYFGAVTEELAAACDKNLITALPELMSEGRMYVVTPAKICNLMNQYINARQIHNRRLKGQCLVCGKQITSGLVCRGHFKTHERVYYE